MKILLIVIGMALAFSTGASAHRATVVIKKADKVLVKSGMSHKKAMGMVYCLLSLKKHDTAEAAIAAAMTKIKDRCALLNMDDEKCAKKQRKAAHHISNCFAKAEFMRDYIKQPLKTE